MLLPTASSLPPGGPPSARWATARTDPRPSTASLNRRISAPPQSEAAPTYLLSSPKPNFHPSTFSFDISFPSLLHFFRSSLSSFHSSLVSSLSQLWLFLTFQLIIHPDALAKVRWDWFLLLSILYNTLAVPFVIAFTPSLATSPLVLALDIATTLLMTCDMLIILRTAVVDHSHTLIYDTPFIAHRYLHSTAFYVDLLSTFPFFVLSYSFNSEAYPVFTINVLKLPSVLRASRMFRSPRIADSTASPKLRIVRFLLWFMYLAHCFACGWFFIGLQQPDGATLSWIVRKGLQSSGIVPQYIDALYWALETMCTCGYGDNLPVTPYEQTYTIFVLMATGVVYAAVFGNMTNAIQALSTSSRRHHGILDGVHEFSDIYALPLRLHLKLLTYAQQHWNHTKGFEIGEVIHALPSSVKSKILLHINSTLIRRVPFFKNSPPRFVDAIILKLHNLVCMPGDYVFREGDMSRDIYFIKHGRVEVIMDDPTAIGEQEVVIAELGGESPYPFFGEISLLLGETRTASVRAKEVTMLSMMSMADFYDVMSQFSNEEDTLREVAMSRLRGDLERMAIKDAEQGKEKAHQLAVMALDVMKEKAKKWLSHLEAAHRQRTFLVVGGEMRGLKRFREAVLRVIGSLAEKKAAGNRQPLNALFKEVKASHPTLTLTVEDEGVSAATASIGSSPVATPHILGPPLMTSLPRQSSPSGNIAGAGPASCRVRQYRSQESLISPASTRQYSRQHSFTSSRGSGCLDREAMTAVLRSSTLRELKHLVLEKDAAEGEVVEGSKSASHSRLSGRNRRGSEVGTPVSRASVSAGPNKDEMLFLLNHQGTMRDVLSMNLLTAGRMEGGKVSARNGASREASRPHSPDIEDDLRGKQSPIRSRRSIGRGDVEGGMVVSRGLMMEKLAASQGGRTLASPSHAAMNRGSLSSRITVEGIVKGDVESSLSHLPSFNFSPMPPGRGVGVSVKSPATSSPSHTTLSPSLADSPTNRGGMRRIMTGDMDELTALKKARDDKFIQVNSKGKALREGGLSASIGEGGQTPRRAQDGVGDSAAGAERLERRRTAPKRFALRTSAPIMPVDREVAVTVADSDASASPGMMAGIVDAGVAGAAQIGGKQDGFSGADGER